MYSLARKATRLHFSLAAAIAILGGCDGQAQEWYKFNKLSIEQQYSLRTCPAAAANLPADSYRDITVRFGNYAFEVDESYVSLGGVAHYKAGDPEYVNGQQRLALADRTFIPLDAIGPNMVSDFPASRAANLLVRRGLLYKISIRIFWSEDGLFNIGETNLGSLISNGEFGDGLSFEKYAFGDYVFRPVHDPRHTRGSPLKITCYTKGCWVKYQVRSDIWVSYGFAAVNLRCWSDIHSAVDGFIEERLSTNAVGR